jgi:hypothetical protein
MRTPGPWEVREWSDTLGYDCMTGGVAVSGGGFKDIAVLDGADYGQARCSEISVELRAEIEANAAFIVEACNNYERVCAERDDLASAARRLLAELSTSDSETQVNLWKEIQAMERALAELKP